MKYTVKNLLNELMKVRKSKKTGSEAIEEAIAGFKQVIIDLNVALVDAGVELDEATAAIREAEVEQSRIVGLLSKGENFVGSLEKML